MDFNEDEWSYFSLNFSFEIFRKFIENFPTEMFSTSSAKIEVLDQLTIFFLAGKDQERMEIELAVSD